MLSPASRGRMPTIGVGACSATAIAAPPWWARSASRRHARYTMFDQMFAEPVNRAMKLADWPGSGSVCDTRGTGRTGLAIQSPTGLWTRGTWLEGTFTRQRR